MAEIYPDLDPYKTHAFKVSETHTLYVEECGNPEGEPVIYLHGGPGAGTNPFYRRLFNPEKWRIISYDQRGCGKSTPLGELKENTTWHLVEDIEKIRESMGIERWTVCGGSWGATLALAYALTFVERVKAIILRGVFLGSRDEIRWLYQGGASKIFPDVWESFVEQIPIGDQNHLVEGYWKKLNDQSKQVRESAAVAWSVWEGIISQLVPDTNHLGKFSDPTFAEVFAKIECHYFRNNVFFNDKNFILKNMKKLRHTPGYIVHGRYDIVCLVEYAWALHKAWPKSRLHIVPDAGHSITEPGIASKIAEITDYLVAGT